MCMVNITILPKEMKPDQCKNMKNKQNEVGVDWEKELLLRFLSPVLSDSSELERELQADMKSYLNT